MLLKAVRRVQGVHAVQPGASKGFLLRLAERYKLLQDSTPRLRPEALKCIANRATWCPRLELCLDMPQPAPAPAVVGAPPSSQPLETLPDDVIRKILFEITQQDNATGTLLRLESTCKVRSCCACRACMRKENQGTNIEIDRMHLHKFYSHYWMHLTNIDFQPATNALPMQEMRAMISKTGAIWEHALAHYKLVRSSNNDTKEMPHEFPARCCMQLLGQMRQMRRCENCHRQQCSIVWEWRAMCELSILPASM